MLDKETQGRPSSILGIGEHGEDVEDVEDGADECVQRPAVLRCGSGAAACPVPPH